MSLILVDGHALIFKMYYAFLRHPMINSKGEDTSVIFGFTKSILELIKKEKPTHFAVAFDPPAKTFRHELYPEYKANRSETPELVKAALVPLTEILGALNIPVLMKPGFEADDVIGSMAKRAAGEGMTVYMYTPDKDYGQLISDNVFQYRPPKSGGEGEIIGKREMCEKYCISDPEQFKDILAIWGDTSDNIPGIPGIGEKGATKLIALYGSIDGIYNSLDKLTPKQKSAFESNRQQLERSRILVTIDTGVDIGITPSDLVLREPGPATGELMKRYEITSLLKYLPQAASQAAAQDGSTQASDTGTPENIPATEKTTLPHSTSGEDTAQAVQTGNDAPEKIVTDMKYTLTDINAFYGHISGLKSESRRISVRTETATDNGIDSAISRIILYSDGLLCRINGDGSTDTLKKILEIPDLTLCGANIKFSLNLFRRRGIRITGARLLDVELMHYLLNPERQHGIDTLMETYLETGSGSEPEKEPEQPTLFSIREENGPEEDTVSEKRCIAAWLIAPVLEKELAKAGEDKLYNTIEMPLIYVLSEMEFNGVKLDTESLSRQSIELDRKLEAIEKEARLLAGEPDLNLSSPKQLGPVIYEKLNLNPKIKKNKKANYPTDEETLSTLADKHPFINKLLEYREIKKLVSTYINPLPKLISGNSGKIHTTFNQSLTATGRLSSVKPNLQNIPIRTETGREIRRNFISSFEGGAIISADYSQIELRIMAAISGEKHMIEDFIAGKDIHTATAARVFGVPESEVTKEQRRKAKVANFGIIYGISAFGLSQRLSIGREESKEIINEYFNTYSGIKGYMEKTIATAREKGYVETIYGRKRYLKDINSRNATVRAFAERNAINAPIQGSAADIIKLAMIALQKELERGKFKSRMILQVHDELVFDASPDEITILSAIIKDKMENVIKLPVPLTVECNWGKNWLEAH